MPYTGVAIMCYASRVYLKRDNFRLIQEKNRELPVKL